MKVKFAGGLLTIIRAGGFSSGGRSHLRAATAGSPFGIQPPRLVIIAYCDDFHSFHRADQCWIDIHGDPL